MQTSFKDTTFPLYHMSPSLKLTTILTTYNNMPSNINPMINLGALSFLTMPSFELENLHLHCSDYCSNLMQLLEQAKPWTFSHSNFIFKFVTFEVKITKFLQIRCIFKDILSKTPICHPLRYSTQRATSSFMNQDHPNTVLFFVNLNFSNHFRHQYQVGILITPT